MIFLNMDAVGLDDLFLNDDWKLVPMYKNIYNLYVQGEELGWIVKVYEKKKYAKQESMNLNKLKNYPGFPKLLATGFSIKLNYNVISKENGLDLHEYCSTTGKKFFEREVKDIARELLKLISKMHKKKIIHGDIKPENIIYDPASRKLSLIDFEGKHTREYASPEQIFSGIAVTNKTDLWSLGVVLYWLMTATYPFANYKELRDKRLKLPVRWSSEFKEFIYCLIERDISLRYDADEALNHTWIQE